jgi:hypothetical protein
MDTNEHEFLTELLAFVLTHHEGHEDHEGVRGQSAFYHSSCLSYYYPSKTCCFNKVFFSLRHNMFIRRWL